MLRGAAGLTAAHTNLAHSLNNLLFQLAVPEAEAVSLAAEQARSKEQLARDNSS